MSLRTLLFTSLTSADSLTPPPSSFANTARFIIVFVCHDNQTTKEALTKTANPYVIFVGDKEVDEAHKNNPKVIIARDLPQNIETEKSLLTFTAWYAIIKNNLFQEYDYICVLEYDVIMDRYFEQTLIDITNINNENRNDVISFIPCGSHFFTDINESVLNQFINKKGLFDIYKYIGPIWYSTTNHCIQRRILSDFVDWYYPDCLMIKELDAPHLSWYHERIFHVYMKSKNLNIAHIKGLKHLYRNSHNGGFAKN